MRSAITTKVIVMSLTVIGGLLFIAGVLHFREEEIAVEDLPAAARVALHDQNWELAEDLAIRFLKHHPQSVEVLEIAGHAAANRNRIPFVLKYYAQVPDDGSESSNLAQARCGQLLLQAGWLSEAERHLRKVLAQQPDLAQANHALIYILRIEGRNRECLPLIERLWKLEGPNRQHLFILGSANWYWIGDDDKHFLEFCQNEVTSDPISSLGLALQLTSQNKFDEAIGPLFEVVSTHPNNLHAQALLGSTLLQLDRQQDFLDWNRRLPDTADQSELVWFAWGLWAQTHNQPEVAIRCFGEILVRDPNHRRANYQIAQLLISKGRGEVASRFSERAAQLEALEDNIQFEEDDFLKDSRVKERVGLLEDLGRFREALGWTDVSFESESVPEWASQARERIQSQFTANDPLTIAASNPVLKIDLSEFPLPVFEDENVPTKNGTDEDAGKGSIAFVDDASNANLLFSFFNGASPTAGRAFMFEFSGGGIAVLDYDQDGWPDINLTQGSGYPFDSSQRTFLDRLFRNLGDDRFQDVTTLARLGDALYSQGATVGDVNNDGFPDLYLANIGQNRLYVNNGDGTFDDVTLASQISGEVWTVSCLLADLNGDSLPDIYDVNYLSGKDVFTRSCDADKRPIQCPINYFDAEQDRLYLNLGDGRFRDVTDESGIKLPDGKGMGIVAADFDGSGRLGLFISNDTTPNYFFQNKTTQAGDVPLFEDVALISGIARNGAGDTESCMGIAVEDCDGDGLLDVFVTNYYQESNTFYRQRPDQGFEDFTQRANLNLSSLNTLGWGAQFIDADNDGRRDLVVANGHLDDYRYNNIPFIMAAQFYWHTGNGRFQEIQTSALGAYFQELHQGRAVARLDWNRDGLEDICITHVDAPVALLTNRTKDAGHFCAIQLRGVQSSRDAIGARIRIVANGQSFERQLTAGDGFEASNQRQLVFGLGDVDHIDEIHVRWPSGNEQVLESLIADQQLLLIEGRAEPIGE